MYAARRLSVPCVPGAVQELREPGGLGARAGPPELGGAWNPPGLSEPRSPHCNTGLQSRGWGRCEIRRSERLKGLPHDPLLVGPGHPGPSGFRGPHWRQEAEARRGTTAHADFEDGLLAAAGGPGPQGLLMRSCQAESGERENRLGEEGWRGRRGGGGEGLERTDGGAGRGAALGTQEEPAVCPGRKRPGRALGSVWGHFLRPLGPWVAADLRRMPCSQLGPQLPHL